MTLVDIDLRTTDHLGAYATVKAVDLKFVGPVVDSENGFVIMPTEFTVPYNPRGEHDYVMVLDLVPGRWTIAGLPVLVPDSQTPVRLIDIIETETEESNESA